MKFEPNSETPARSGEHRSGHLELLSTLILLLVGQSFLSDDSLLQRSLFNVLFLFVVISAIRTLSRSRFRRWAAATAGVFALLLVAATEYRPSTVMSTATYLCYVVVFALLLRSLAESVFGGGLVDFNRIAGAASIYLLIGLLFTLAYCLLETLRPGSFNLETVAKNNGVDQDIFGDFLYFSNVTLTTLGFGDIVPVSKSAKSLATFEAIIGQLFMAIIMARLVGLHIAQTAKSD